MSFYRPIEITRELAEDAIANCDYCGAPATGGYSLGWRAAWSCDKSECRKKLDEAVVNAVAECHPEDKGVSPDQVRIVQISNAFLCELLQFPSGTRIVGYNAAASWQSYMPDLELKVVHPDFSPIIPGHRITYVSPQYQTNLETGSVEFVSW